MVAERAEADRLAEGIYTWMYQRRRIYPHLDTSVRGYILLAFGSGQLILVSLQL